MELTLHIPCTAEQLLRILAAHGNEVPAELAGSPPVLEILQVLRSTIACDGKVNLTGGELVMLQWITSGVLEADEGSDSGPQIDSMYQSLLAILSMPSEILPHFLIDLRAGTFKMGGLIDGSPGSNVVQADPHWIGFQGIEDAEVVTIQIG